VSSRAASWPSRRTEPGPKPAPPSAGTGVTVNALLPGGATLTGMIPDGYPAELRTKLLSPEVIVPPLLWLASERSDGVTGMRFDAAKWRVDLPDGDAAYAARDDAGWASVARPGGVP
jgi:hypothetical protein